MASITHKLHKHGLISPPDFLEDNVQYEVVAGSTAYGVAQEGTSDFDIIGFCIPPKEILFPHLAGEIRGFDKHTTNFGSFEAQHIKLEPKEYDLKIYNIVKFFRLAADGSPMILESLFAPIDCLLHTTPIGNLVRENRKLFLSKKLWHTLKGYAYSQMSSMQNRKFENSKRREDVEKYGYSLKYGYHVVRLLNEAEQVLMTGDLDLRANKEQLKAIRRGEWSLEQIKDHFNTKEKQLEELYIKSTAIPHDIREEEIKALLIEALELHYGSLSSAVSIQDKHAAALRKIKNIIDSTL